MIEFFSAIGDTCKLNGGDLFGWPTWYKYLSGVQEENGLCSPQIGGLSDIWLIVLAIIELLLRAAILVAIAFIMIGGFKYITSRANPEKTSSARNTIQDALIGLVIAVVATAVVSFIASRF